MKKHLTFLTYFLLATTSIFAQDNKKSIYEQCFNKSLKIEYVEDGFYQDEKFIELDHWQTPFITKLKEKGDCEDLSFYLYDLLKKQGLESRLVWGYAEFTENQGEHIWIEYIYNNQTLILDPSFREKGKIGIFNKEQLTKKDLPKYTEDNGLTGIKKKKR